MLAACDLDQSAYHWADASMVESDAGPPSLLTRGRFEIIEGVDLNPEGATQFARADGLITTGDMGGLYRASAVEESCTLFTLDSPALCSGVCAGLCIAEDHCVDKPVYLSAGDLTLTGLTERVDLVQEPDNSYRAGGPLPLDLFTSEAVVRLGASGEDILWFAMATGGVRPIDADLPLTPVVLGDTDLVISWANPDTTSNIVLELFAANQIHGQPLPAILRCTERDDGAIVVDASLLAQFPSTPTDCAGIDCPRSRLRRMHIDSLLRSGVPIDLTVASDTMFAIAKP
jgi:hypothetical protein